MIETEKMLHLRRYLTLIVRSQLYSSRCETKSRLPRHGGYVFSYVHPQYAALRPETYVTCNRMYSSTVPQSSPSDVVDHKLTSFCDNVKKGQVSADGLREVIDLCNKNNYQLPHDTGVLLLKCCGSLLSDLQAAERDHLASQVWHLAKKNENTMTLEYYNTLLSINEENSKFVNPKSFLVSMNVEPDENTYRFLLNVATKTGNSEYIWDMLTMIKDKNIIVYEEAISALVQICMANGNIAEAERIISLMQNAKLSTTKVYTELACGYAKLGDIPNLVKILNEEPQSNANLLRIIKILSISNNSRHIPVVLNFLTTSVLAIEPEISKMIAELIHANQVADAYTIINYFVTNNVNKNIVQSLVNSFMNEIIISNASINDIIKYANDFIDSECSQYTLTDIAEISLKLGREKLCLAVFQAMKNKNIEIRPHYYWPLLLKAYYNKGEAEIYSLLKSMIDKGVEIDSDTLLNYVLPYVNTAIPNITFQRLLLNDVPSVVSLTSLISFLLRQNRLLDITPLCTYYARYMVHYRELIKPLIRAYLATKNVKNCARLLTTFPQGRDFVSLFFKLLLKPEYPIYIEDLQLFLEEFKKYEVKISQDDAIILKNKLEKHPNFNVLTKLNNLIDDLVDINVKNSAIALHPKYMSTKELTCHLVELKSTKAHVRNILHKLLVMYCIENNLKKAEEIKQEYDAYQYEWRPNMKAILFELYIKNDKLNEAETLLSNLHVMPGEFQIDKIKMVMYATALVKADKFTKAFEVIDTHNTIDTKKRDAQVQCHTLLQTLAQSQYRDRTEDMLQLLLKRNYCELSTDLLKPLVAIPLERNDIVNAVNIFLEFAEKYYKAPLALDILTALLQQKHSSKLQNVHNYIEQVYDVTATTYSIKVANTLLAIALATLNKTENLQTLVQTHELSMNCLVYYINNTKNNNYLDGLQTLFKVVNANHLDQDVISNTLLSVYSKMGDCNRALELWEIMCTKNINPSKQFNKSFRQFLLSNKLSLPPKLNK